MKLRPIPGNNPEEIEKALKDAGISPKKIKELVKKVEAEKYETGTYDRGTDRGTQDDYLFP